MNSLFQNALKSVPQKTPPIWFMRQAGRYHQHYQGMRSKNSFEELCRQPELAAQVALGPVLDFDFDVSILFSDILFPLDGLGMKLSYSDTKGPQLQHLLKDGYQIQRSQSDEFVEKALNSLLFQAQALKITREVLPKNKSLIGFVGGLWTLFVYACEGGHAGAMTFPKNHFFQNTIFVETLKRVIKGNIELQIQAGAEVVMIFDTAAGEVSYQFFQHFIEPTLSEWANAFPGKLGYYSKGTQECFFSDKFFEAPWAGQGVDHRCSLPHLLVKKNKDSRRTFLQGNFDQAILFQETELFKKSLNTYLHSYKNLTEQQRAGWVCGLGHGVLPKTPENHVRLFIDTVRKAFS